MTAPTISRPGRRPDRRRLTVRQYTVRTLGGVATLIFVSPFLYAISTSLRPAQDVAEHAVAFPTSITFSNFSRVYSEINYGRSVFNTLLITAGTCAIVVLLGSMAGYALGRTSRSWSTWVYRGFMAGMAVPLFVLVAPLYLLVRDLGLLGSIPGVILIYAASNLPIAIFFYTSFVRSIPGDLDEAAQLDGASRLRTFFSIFFPLLGPVTATLLLFITLAVWNDLLVPLVFLQNADQRTIMVNAYALLDPKIAQPTDLFPSALMGVAPLLLLFVFFQRRMVEGMSGGAVKG
ncbi:carbohydrate ABC transporter permease [Streptomyces sp. CBMA29]|uniref:carbohydrate ABC transporter permease n=1 Tax=Streptomyces sp. CBMA29 TaxID=1896314 RepID=UPI001661CF56|nr:carbohydrate ABC transporter permease [Streptomyces sp. CBMA29]MBD0737846.1 sugar ABC transporter permease [Streptomyces sp. CBMA29]